MTEAMRRIALALRSEPHRAELHAALGNALVRQTRYLEAIAAYRAALACDPTNAAAALALAELLAIACEPDARPMLTRALELRRLYEDPQPRGARTPVTLLLRDASYSTNTPLELIADRDAVALDKCYVEGATPPAFDGGVLFCAFGYAAGAQPALEAALRVIERARLPVVNDPRRLAALAREHLAETLGGLDRVRVPAARRVMREELAYGGPCLVRPADTHAGAGLARIDDAEGLAAHLQRFPAPAYHCTEFIEYASADGFYRKYRIVFINGEPFAYHLAISPRWMVHYRNAPMAAHRWMRDEEAAFLDDPRAVFSSWDGALREIGRRVGLEYFGIDCALGADGTILVFEADPSMLLHGEDPAGDFAYKNAAVRRIRDALTAMLQAKVQSTS